MEMTCTIDGCEKPVRARDWCTTHYSRWTRTGDPESARAYGQRQCGTETAYSRHIKAGEKPCNPCRIAHNDYQQRDRDRRRAARDHPGNEGPRLTPVELMPATGLVDTDDGHPVPTPCQLDPETWFPVNGEGAHYAVSFCNTCPVKNACLQAAMDLERGMPREHRHGIWGSKTPTERARIDKERTAA